MDSSFFLGTTTLALLFSSFLYVLLAIFKADKIRPAAIGLTIVSLLLLTTGVILRWVESYQMGIGHAPLTNMYESVVFFTWCILLFYLYVEFKYKLPIFGVLILPMAFLAMAYGSFSDINKDIVPLVPALQSNWLISHVITCFVGYAAFGVGGCFGIAYIYKNQFDGNGSFLGTLAARMPDLETIDDLTHKTLIFGFIWLSGGIITGAVWANSAWGTYWSWDPKETWSLITWFVYAITLHARFTWGWNGKIIAYLSIIGFLSVLFTYYGVNFWLAGLHSYGSV